MIDSYPTPEVGIFLNSFQELAVGSRAAEQEAPQAPSSSSTVLVSETPEAWVLDPHHLQHSGLVAKRPFHRRFDEVQSDIDEAVVRFDREKSLNAVVTVPPQGGVQDRDAALAAEVREHVEGLLSTAALPAALGEQILSDACALGKAVALLCPSARELEVKLEIFGENSCSRWHQDRYVCRAIVSYTGAVGTEYTADANVNFWELRNCGNNDHIIRDPQQICSVDVGDFFFIKGTKYPNGAKGLVHRSPEKRYHPDGHVVNRLLLKIDVAE